MKGTRLWTESSWARTMKPLNMIRTASFVICRCAQQTALPKLMVAYTRCFYIDTPDNARMNGMVVKDKREGDITRQYVGWRRSKYFRLTYAFHSLSSIAELITSNGGRLGALEEPKLTHIILDKRDVSRRKELGARTSKSVSPSFTVPHEVTVS
jgi:hypothetical protein